ncbi:MAG: hypothetical protein WKG07_29765 [Hymenobacter sp.]
MATDTAAARANAMANAAPGLSLIDLILKGGWVMLPIFLLLIVSIYIIAERYLTIRSAAGNPRLHDRHPAPLDGEGRLAGRQALLRPESSPLARMVEKGLRRIGLPITEIEASVENVGKIEIARLEKNISILGIIAGHRAHAGLRGHDYRRYQNLLRHFQ